MSIPTTSPFPYFRVQDKLADWARNVSEFMARNIGVFSWPEQRIILTNGANNNVNLKGGSFVHIIGPTAAFNITGFGGGSPGREIIIHNFSSGTMTLNEENVGSAAPNRIHTFVGDVATPIATLLWDHQSQRWILMQSQGTSSGILPVFEVPTPAPNDVATTFTFSASWSSNRLAFFRNGVLQQVVGAAPGDGQYTIAKPAVTMGTPPYTEDNLFGIYWPQ